MMGFGFIGSGVLAMVFVCSVALLLLGTAFVVVLVEAAHRHEWTPRTRSAEPSRRTAEDEFELRYAGGEIDATTLVQRRAVLRQP
jgi:hypothetical protein